MSTSESNDHLQAGIAAVKSGDKVKARALLMSVVEAEESNEQAWLWLSTTMETEEDRRICLENVLALNPNSRIAQQGLKQVTNDTPSSQVATSTSAIHGDSDPGKYPSLDELDQRVQEPGPGASLSKSIPTTTSSVAEGNSPTFSDVWDTDEEICAYCAAILGESDRKCPSCARSLVSQKYRYPATANLHVFWVFMLTTGLLLGFQAGYKSQVEQNDAGAMLHLITGGLLSLLVIGVYFRLFWAHILSIIVLILVLLLSIGNFLIPIDPSTLGTETMDPVFHGFASSFIQRLGWFLRVMQATIGVVTLAYAIFRAGPEFDRVKERAVARTKKGLHTAADYHLVAREQMQKEMWASAILQWQKATAIDPSNIVYQKQLAKAYLRLGFLDRGLSVLQTAQTLSMQDSTKAEIEKLIRWAQQKIAAKPKDT
jgi:hypothetical protein